MNDSLACVNSIFEQPWWLDAVAPGIWDEVIVEQSGEVIARLTFVKTKRLGFKLIGLPDYTQTTSCWVKQTGAKNAKKFSRDKDLITELIKQLPKGYNVDLRLDHKCDYLLPFFWAGFSVRVNYSYRLENIENTEALWAGLAENIRTDIRKALRTLHVEDNRTMDDLIELRNKSFHRQGRNSCANRELLLRLDKVLLDHNARKLLCAVDDLNRIHAAAYFVYDENTCYYLIGGGDPELRNSGAASLLLWEGMRFASTVSKAFDFEGSMIEDIERFFRAFGGTPTPYYRVTRLNPALSFADYMKPKVKRILGW